MSSRAALLVTMAFGLTMAVPPGAVPDGGGFPLSWLTWFAQRPAWSAAAAFVGLPVQQQGAARPSDGKASAESTQARGGAGRAPIPASGTLEPYQPHSTDAAPRVTGAAAHFDEKTSKRMPERATAKSDVYANADGSYTRRAYSRPVNYQTADGTWQAIDPNLERRSDGRLHMRANSLQVSLAGTSSAAAAHQDELSARAGELAASSAELASLILPSGEVVAYRLTDAADVTPVVSGPTATYHDILPQTDLELSTFDAGLKEVLILKSPDAQSSWVFPLRLVGLTPRLTDSGSVDLLDASGKAVAWFPRGFMTDSKIDPASGAATQSANVTFELITVDDGPALRVTADEAWLRDPARVYPVRVDPTTTTGTTGDVYVDNDSSTGDHNGDNLPVGTYNGGTVKARSFIHLDEFDEDGMIGRRITAARLKLYLSWAYNCTSNKPFSVHRVTQKWSVADLTNGSYPGPTISDPIGSLAISDTTPACNNSSGDRSVGKWVTVSLNPATFNDWSSGGVNNGIALTASETDSTAWKRFTAANYSSGAYKPYAEFDYVANVAPQVNVRYPANNLVVSTLTPELIARGHDPDNWPNKGLTYNFVVYDAATGAEAANSGWTAGSWTVPSGKLGWNKSYLYTVRAYDKAGYSAIYPAYSFTTSVPQPLLTASLAQNAGKGYDPSIGNYTTSATDASVATVGPSLSITRSYNSLDTRRQSAFGTGWSSVLDTRATQVTDVAGAVQSVLITYPTGQDIAFGRNADGTFTPPSGRFATFKELKDAGGAVTGYTLTDKDASVYTFGQAAGQGVFKVSTIADANGRQLQFQYDAAANLARMTSASGRFLQFAWTTPTGSTYPHVSTVSTNPVVADDSTTVDTWEYTYSAGDQLTKVCPPTGQTHCTTYQQTATSQLTNTVVNVGPYSYWPLNEPAGATVAASRVLTNAGADNAGYHEVQLGQPAGMPGSTATTAGFNGTSSYLQLPGNLIADGQYQSISMWFKTTATNGVLFSYSGEPLSKGTATGNYTPALYIDSDGKLRGELWHGSAAPINSDVPVNDGEWHQVVLAGAGNSQTLYLDGVARGTLAGTIAQIPNGASNVYVGAGFIGQTWPDHANSGADPTVSYFAGSISDVAVFNQALTASTVAALHNAGRTSHSVLSKVTRPSGGVTAEISYDTATGKVATVTDEHGGVWTLGTPAVAGSSTVYAASVLGAKPTDYWRLGEVDVTEAVNEVQGNAATYNSVTLGTEGPFADNKAASFDGTSSYLSLPADVVPSITTQSVGMWFKMPAGSTAGGTLLGLQIDPMTESTITGWTPALYVGTDGKLRGKWCWCGSVNTSITTTTGVNDGKWHQVVLTLGGNVQKLYLDGVLVGSLNQANVNESMRYVTVGAGTTKNWPSSSLSNQRGYFTGSIAEVAFFSSELSATQVAGQFQASKQTAPVAVTMVSGVATAIPMPVSTVEVTGPSGERLSYSYDLVNGNRMVAQSDALGNVTKFGYDVGGYGNLVYDPRGVWTQDLQDARGNTKQKITCQDQAANRCSSVYYTYFPDATTTTLTPDARNDLLLTVRDGRSASETDNTYLTSYGYDAKGNQTAITDALGRVTATTYTDGTSVPAFDSGFPPAGLPSTVITPGGTKQSVVYYANGDVAQVTDPAGKIVRYAYDGLGRVLTETEITEEFPAGLVTSYTYDRLGRQLTETEPAVTNRVTGAVHTARTTTGYDHDGNVLTETTTDLTGGDASRTESHVYNGYGQETSVTNALGSTTRFEYDAYGRVIKETEPDGGVVRNTYDVEGNLLTSTILGFTGDPNNPSPARDLVTESRTYDPAGRLASETDAMGWTTSYTYTDNGLVVKTVRTDGTSSFVVEENSYDAAGNVVKQVTNNGATTTVLTYDAAGRQTSSTLDPDGLKRTTALTYDRDDNVVSTTESGPSGVVGLSEAIYDSAGQVIAETTYRNTQPTPVTRWRLNETSGSTAADSTGNTAGTTTPGVTWSTERGGSAVFDGSASIDTAVPVIDTSRGFTVSAWAKPTELSQNRAVLSQSGPDAQSAFSLRVDHVAGDKWSVLVFDEDNPTSVRVGVTAGQATLNTWAHLAAVYDATAKQLRLYVNGTLAGTTPMTWEPFRALEGFSVGRLKWQGSYVDGWIGSVSDVQAYQRALTTAEVGQVFGGTVPAAGAEVIRTTVNPNQDGNPKSVTDPNGQTTYYSYDEAGQTVKVTSPAVMAESPTQGAGLANPISWTGYNTFGEATDTRDPNGNWSVVEYDAIGRPVAQNLPSYTAPGASTPVTPRTTRSYDAVGQVLAETDALGKSTSYEYDQLGRVAEMTAPNDGVTTYAYDLVGDLLSQTDPTGAVNTATYDYLGRQLTTTQVVRQAGTHHTTTYSYGTGGWLSQMRTAAGVTTSTTYNAAGEPLTTTDGANNTTTYTYDAAGRVVRTTLPDGTYTSTTYDLADRAVSTSSHSAAGTALTTRSSRYDRVGNVVASTDAKGVTTTFEYDAAGRLVKELQPISGSDSIQTMFGYDLAGNSTRFTDGRGNAFLTSYNSWNLPESTIEPSTTAHPAPADRTFTIAYDKAGRPVNQTLPGGVSLSNTYNDLGQVTRQTGSGAEVATEDRTFAYDLTGRMTSLSGTGGSNTLTYDDRGLLLSVTGPSGDSTFAYNQDGQVASRDDAAGTTSYTYDGAGRLATIVNSGAGVQLSNTYNSLSQVSKITYGASGNTRNFGFDDLHRPVTDELKTATGTSIGKIAYGWDTNDNIISKTTTGFAGAATNTYTYDQADRLTSWNNGTATSVYAYDKSGNRVQNGSKLFMYDQRSRLLTGDGVEYVYTARGTLASAGGMTTRADAFGQVLSQDSAAGTQSYSYDGLGRAIRPGFAYTGLGNDLASDGAATYVRDPAGGLVGEAAGATKRLAWTDLHTDVVGQFTDTGTALAGSTTYDPLGKVLATTGMIGSLGYQSEWTDAFTGRVNMHARWYNTETGQFDTRDTVSNSPAPDSINANRYQYGDGNPLTVTDPTGHFGSWLRDKIGRGVSKVTNAVTSTVSRAASYVSTAVSATRTYVAQKAQAVKQAAVKAVNKAKQTVKKVAKKVAKTVKKKIDQGRKWVAKKYNAAKQKVKQTYNKAKQAGKKVAAKATRVVKKAASAVKDAANATAKWVQEHKDVLLEVAAIGGAILAGLACTAVTVGAGALACMVGAGALINLAKDAAQGDINSIGDALGSLGTGAISGLVGGAGGMIAGRVAAAVASRVGTGIAGRLATEAVENGVSEVFDQAVTTGRVDPKAALLGMIPGLGLLNRKGGGASKGGGGDSPAKGSDSDDFGGSCPIPRKHSFDPATQVLMADGTVRPIEDVNVGDHVVATDPETGVSLAKPVTELHRNTDWELTDLTVRDQDGNTTTLETTQNHPFWNVTEREWTDAKNLNPGTKLHVAGKGEVTVQTVVNYHGSEEMRDLTVADIHTYYVVAGNDPVLVHNNNPGIHKIDHVAGCPYAKVPSAPTTTVGPGTVPQKAVDMLNKVNKRENGEGKIPGYQGNASYSNKGGELPDAEKYKEFDVNLYGSIPCPNAGCPGSYRGPERIVVGRTSGKGYYTPDHYENLHPIT
ncbi:LamG-like jellyroll fold domain-containing protein [Micromonospora sp. NPDC003197]